MLELKKVRKCFGSLVAVDTVDLEVGTARSTALIGPSGSGKSTLLRIIMGLISPDSGEILVSSKPMTSENALSLRTKMGYVRQDGGLFPHLTARDNIQLMAKYLKWTPEALFQRTKDLCELARFEPSQLNRYPTQLSGGQRQRVSLMRALMLDPDILLLDEPLAALDPIIRRELQEELVQLFRKLRKSVILVTHDLSEAGYLAEELVLLANGQILQRGPLQELINRPASDYVRQFVGAQRSLAEVLFS